MEMGRYLVEAVVFGGQSPNQLARIHPTSRSWLFRLLAFNARITAGPSQPGSTTHYRIRRDRVDADGKVTLRFLSQLRHIHVGRAHSRTSVLLFIAGPYVRICTDDGIVLRELNLDPSRKYQPSTSPKVVASQLRPRSTVS